MTAAVKKAGSGKVVDQEGSDRTEVTFRYTATGLDQHVVRQENGVVEEIIRINNAFYMKGLPTSKDTWVKVVPTDKDTVEKAEWLEKHPSSPLDFSQMPLFGRFTQVSSRSTGNTFEGTVEGCVILNACDAKNSVGVPVKLTIVLDPQDRPLKFVMSTALGDATSTYSNWGAAVTISAPKLEGAAAPQ